LALYTWLNRRVLIDTVRDTLIEGVNIPLCPAGIEIYHFASTVPASIAQYPDASRIAGFKISITVLR
jgi:hypothetical protein